MRHRPKLLTPSLVAQALAILAVCLSACATIPPGGRGIEGVVVHAGVEAVLSLQRDGYTRAVLGSERVVLQLDRIPGALVAVKGDLLGDDRVRVRTFKLLDPGDGLSPMVGSLIVDQAGVVIEDENTGTSLLLRGKAIADLKRHHGGRVWVTGSVIGPRQVLVAHWGLLLTSTEVEQLH